jgi:hypothetical protein
MKTNKPKMYQFNREKYQGIFKIISDSSKLVATDELKEVPNDVSASMYMDYNDIVVKQRDVINAFEEALKSFPIHEKINVTVEGQVSTVTPSYSYDVAEIKDWFKKQFGVELP